MSRLGSYSGERVVRVFQRAGWGVARQKGSHVILEKEGYEATLSVPIHKGRDVKRGTLRDLIRDARKVVHRRDAEIAEMDRFFLLSVERTESKKIRTALQSFKFACTS